MDDKKDEQKNVIDFSKLPGFKTYNFYGMPVHSNRSREEAGRYITPKMIKDIAEHYEKLRRMFPKTEEQTGGETGA